MARHAARRKMLNHFARLNRKKPTEAEALLWPELKKLGFTIRRQGVVASYIPDFVCRRARLAIELDGGYHNTAYQRSRDDVRDITLGRYKYFVLRFTNEHVLNHMPEVLDTIKKILDNRCLPEETNGKRGLRW